MITQKHQNFPGFDIPEEDGFYLTGKDYNDCICQLSEYGKTHPQKWVFLSDCGTIQLSKEEGVQVTEHLFEIMISDEKPTNSMFLWTLFQEVKGK